MENEKKTMLPLVTARDQIQRNAVILGEYLDRTNSVESKYAKGLIKRGRLLWKK
ncbi:hypothetical protein AGMMS49940_09650 [Spirochaetia bacterium]|nr:hypothetical protein AGMMS49940_09650 [Spirochaetia bacterium]